VERAPTLSKKNLRIGFFSQSVDRCLLVGPNGASCRHDAAGENTCVDSEDGYGNQQEEWASPYGGQTPPTGQKAAQRSGNPQRQTFR
jgi:hypothetical protein